VLDARLVCRPGRPGCGPGVGDQAHPPEVHLQLGAGLTVGDTHRVAPLAITTALHREAVQRPVRDGDASPGQQVADLHDRQALGGPPFDELGVGLQRLPRRAVAPWAVGPHRQAHHPDHRVVELRDVAVGGHARRCGRVHVAAHGVAVHTRVAADGPLALAEDPTPQDLSDFRPSRRFRAARSAQ